MQSFSVHIVSIIWFVVVIIWHVAVFSVATNLLSHCYDSSAHFVLGAHLAVLIF